MTDGVGEEIRGRGPDIVVSAFDRGYEATFRDLHGWCAVVGVVIARKRDRRSSPPILILRQGHSVDPRQLDYPFKTAHIRLRKEALHQLFEGRRPLVYTPVCALFSREGDRTLQPELSTRSTRFLASIESRPDAAYFPQLAPVTRYLGSLPIDLRNASFGRLVASIGSFEGGVAVGGSTVRG